MTSGASGDSKAGQGCWGRTLTPKAAARCPFDVPPQVDSPDEAGGHLLEIGLYLIRKMQNLRIGRLACSVGVTLFS